MLTVILWANDMVMVFGADGNQVPEHQGIYQDVLPKLLTIQDAITWKAASPAGFRMPGAVRDLGQPYYVEVPREFMEATLAGEVDRMIALLRAAVDQANERG
jgi:hypothetical protein